MNPLPTAVKTKLLGRFDALIAEGHVIVGTVKAVPGGVRDNWVTGRAERQPPGTTVDWPRYEKWKVNYASLLTQVLQEDHHHRALIAQLGRYTNFETAIRGEVARLEGVRDDFENGFLENLSIRIESAIASDYMGQAEKLLGEGRSGQVDHVPAAVLAGAVLEKTLRTLCDRHEPPISTTKPNGDPLTLDPLVVALTKAGVFTQTVAKQLQAWAHIRNKAAHGEFDEFNRQQVEQMLSGLRDFLARYFA